MIVRAHRNSARPRDHRSRLAVTIGAMVGGDAVGVVAAGEACPWLTLPGRRALVDGDPVPRNG